MKHGSKNAPGPAESDPFREEAFDLSNLQDEIRADDLCGRLLRIFYLDLTQEEKMSAEEASALAYGADYFLREFVIPDRRENLFRLRPGRVRQFAGNWYIVRNMEPNLAELRSILRGVEAFYRYCGKSGRVTPALARSVREECADLDYYGRRIETFLAIERDGYFAWEEECSLKDRS